MSNQLKYILKRIVYSVITIFLLIAITFTLMHMLPGNPFSGGKAIPEATMEALNAKYGLDKPIMEQFFIYIGNVLRGDLGVSVPDGRQITDIIAQAFPVSLELGVRALIFAFIMGILLGVLAAIKRGTVWDSAAMFFALIGVSVPSFIIGSLLQYFLGLKLYQATGTQAIMPVVTVMGPLVAAVLTGAFVVENIFSIPGMGKYFVQSVQANNYSVIAGTTIFYGTFLILANLVVDLIYGLIDPRVKLTGGKE